ncbi:MAG: hypothetical protein MHM6MM_008137 [Cercozoa sp. M6MM]
MGHGSSVTPQVMERVKQLISANKVFVFSKSYCPFCVRVKNVLQAEGIEFVAVELDNESEGSQMQAAAAQLSGCRTVPQVFINGKFVGDCSKTTALARSGDLQSLVNAE